MYWKINYWISLNKVEKKIVKKVNKVACPHLVDDVENVIIRVHFCIESITSQPVIFVPFQKQISEGHQVLLFKGDHHFITQAKRHQLEKRWEKKTFEMLCLLIQIKTLRITWTVMIAIFNICNISFHGLRPLARYFSQGFMKKYLSLRLKSSTTFDWRLWMWTLHLQFSLRSSDLAASSCSRSSIALRVRT